MQRGILWLDVGDLFHWPHREVSGIQRVMASLIVEWCRRPPAGAALRFCRLSAPDGFRAVSAASILAKAAPLLGQSAELPRRGLLGRLRTTVPPTAPDQPGPGDRLLNIGASWGNPPYLDLVAREKARVGLRFIQLVYDIGPAHDPRAGEIARLFTNWLERMLPLADQVVAISDYTRRDLEAFANARGLPLRRPSLARLGDRLPPADWPPRHAALVPLLSAGGYLLTVGSIAQPKNQEVIVRALALLIAQGRRLPPVLWLGRVVERVTLDRALADCPEVVPLLHIVEGADDHDLRLAYERCRFTIFPSLFEGWGLPLAESLALGKPCLASKAASIPEAGGRFADYFDPYDPATLAVLIQRYLDDAALARRQREIRRGYRAASWRQTGQELLRATLA